MEARLKGFVIAFLCVAIAIIYHLYNIQINKADFYSSLAVGQRQDGYILKQNRGMIYDRNMIPLTDREDDYYAVVETTNVQDKSALAEKLSVVSDVYFNEILNSLLKNKISVTHLKGQLNDFKDDNVKIVSVPCRYGIEGLAEHILGYLNKDESSGLSGIEKSFDAVLRQNGGQWLGMISDAQKHEIKGLGYRITDPVGKNKSIKLTIDYHVQKITEDALSNVSKGAAVVIDTKSGDILAMASVPKFNQSNISKTLVSGNGEFINRAITAYNAGSIFKIIVASAALEQNSAYINSSYYCGGSALISGRKILCHNIWGHGEQNLIQAFANSCNPAFIEIGQKTGFLNIINMAKRFGLGERVDLYEGSGEFSGNLPDGRIINPLGTANISIGQGEIMITPLQAAKMANIIANSGIQKKLNLIDSITDEKGTEILKIKSQNDNRVISSYVANLVGFMMREVTVSGTGKIVNLADIGGAAGKTGSAETGWVENGVKMTHAWFAGYFPYDAPKVTIAVFVQDGKSGAVAAAPPFSEIARKIYELKMYN